MTVELAPELLEILACPNCHGSLAVDHEGHELVCTAPGCQLAYPVRDGIPVMLIDDARRPGTNRTDQPPKVDPAPSAAGPAQPPDPAATPPQESDASLRHDDAAPPETAD